VHPFIVIDDEYRSSRRHFAATLSLARAAIGARRFGFGRSQETKPAAAANIVENAQIGVLARRTGDGKTMDRTGNKRCSLLIASGSIRIFGLRPRKMSSNGVGRSAGSPIALPR
jgi:hypothetical protein